MFTNFCGFRVASAFLLFCRFSILFLSVIVEAIPVQDTVLGLWRVVSNRRLDNKEDVRKILDAYMGDMCKVIIGDDEVTLKRGCFGRYADMVALFCPKVGKKFSLKVVEEKKLGENEFFVKTNLLASSGKKAEVDFLVKNEKINEVSCKDLNLNHRQKLILKMVFNFLRNSSDVYQ